ncbi:unnamed protein product, partial [Musa acuminata var. zebrina]
RRKIHRARERGSLPDVGPPRRRHDLSTALSTSQLQRLPSLFPLPPLPCPSSRRDHDDVRRGPRPLARRLREGRLPRGAAAAPPHDLQPRVRPPLPPAEAAPPRGAPRAGERAPVREPRPLGSARRHRQPLPPRPPGQQPPSRRNLRSRPAARRPPPRARPPPPPPLGGAASPRRRLFRTSLG